MREDFDALDLDEEPDLVEQHCDGSDVCAGDARDNDHSTGAAVGAVKWYDPSKGYGFVVPQDGGGDILIHAECLRAMGRAALREGERVSVVFARGNYGRYAQSVRELPRAPAQDRDDELSGSSDVPGEARGDGPLRPARVKWFDCSRGFGFVTVFGETTDVFLHMETVRRCGLIEVVQGEAVAVRTAEGPRGSMVADLRLW